MKRFTFLTCLLLLSAFCLSSVDANEKKEPGKKAVERTRKQVKTLDHIYKTTVVLITENYVQDDDDLAAGMAAKALFDSVKDAGLHEVRLLDATGNPYNDDNIAKDDFEKAGIKALLAGKTGYEEVVNKDGKHYLRSMTPIPVVMKKCTLCHPDYEDVKKGVAIGALSYTLEID